MDEEARVNATNGTTTTWGTPGTEDLFDIIFDYFSGFFTLCPLLGVITNLINMIVFKKLSASDPININFFFLALSDCGISVLHVVTNVAGMRVFAKTMFDKYNVFITEVLYLFFGVPRSVLKRSSIMLTALLTLSRCLCVAMPMKTKQLVTRKTMKATIAGIYMLSFLSLIPVYYVNRVEWVYQPLQGDTYLRRITTENFLSVNIWFAPLDIIVTQLVPYMVIVVCTGILISKLKKRAGWRQSANVTTVAERMVASESRVIKMVVIVAIVFISCYFHNTAAWLANAMGTSLNINELYDEKWLMVMVMALLLIDAVNSSVNFFIYYKHSSKFREVVDNHFFRPCGKPGQ